MLKVEMSYNGNGNGRYGNPRPGSGPRNPRTAGNRGTGYPLR